MTARFMRNSAAFHSTSVTPAALVLHPFENRSP
jgi:hypothetical protein